VFAGLGLSGGSDLFSAELPKKVRINTLIDHVIKALNSGPQCLEDQLPDRLVAAGVVYRDEDLDIAIDRLVDSGRLQALRPRPTEEQPNPQRQLTLTNLPRGFSQASDPFDKTDALAADIHACIKKHGRGPDARPRY
jgi:hypothetical protein